MGCMRFGAFTLSVGYFINVGRNDNAYNAERANVQALINSAPVRIDRSVFKKTEIERVELINAKSKWKRSLK